MSTPCVLITGASGTFGLALTDFFLNTGWSVIAGVRRAAAESYVRERFGAAVSNQRLSILSLNALDLSQCHEVLKVYLQSNPAPNALINNAATDSWEAIEDLTPEVLIEVLQVNLVFPAILTRVLIKHWRDAKQSGSILHISSLLANFGALDSSAYAASKGGLEAFSRAVAVEAGPYGIRSNVLRIAACQHGLTSRHELPSLDIRFTSANNNSTNIELIPLQRRGDIADFCRAASFLVGPEASFITGQELTADGGLSVVYPGYSSPSCGQLGAENV
jgi:3-oxoacyl-[acyl-carrier protein] reductase